MAHHSADSKDKALDLPGSQLFALLRKLGDGGLALREASWLLRLPATGVTKVVTAMLAAIRAEVHKPIPLDHSLEAFPGAGFVAGHGFVSGHGAYIKALHWYEAYARDIAPWSSEDATDACSGSVLTDAHTLNDFFDYGPHTAATSDVAMFLRQFPEFIPHGWRDGVRRIFPGTMLTIEGREGRLMLALKAVPGMDKPAWSYVSCTQTMGQSKERGDHFVFMHREFLSDMRNYAK